MEKKVLIIGGGAAGMCAAIYAARDGADVTILEHGQDVGRKILSTGGGRCNLTNDRLQTESPELLYQSFSDRSIETFLKQAFTAFGLPETQDFFESVGLVTVSKDGYRYPRSMNAASVRTLLRAACLSEHVRIVTDTEVHAFNVYDHHNSFEFQCDTSSGSYASESLILACGGIAAPATGSDGSGFRLAEMLDQPVIAPMPALLPLQGERSRYRALAGLRMSGKVSLFLDDRFVACDEGELQFTEQYVSGIPVFHVSTQAVRALAEGRHVDLVFDLLPEFREKDLIKRLLGRPGADRMTLFTALNGLLPGKACSHFLHLAHLEKDADLPLIEVGEDRVRSVIRLLKDFRVPITGHPGPERAQSTSGGIRIDALEPQTMESKKLPGLYFAGEMIDVTGICGGYNLQWAWTSGALAGKAAAR